MRRYLGPMSADRESFVRTRLQGLRIIAGSLIGALVIFAVVAVVILGLEEYPSPVTAAALFAINVAAFVIVEVVGYRTPAVPRDADEDTAVRVGLDALQQTTITRFAIIEAPALLSLAWAFTTGSAWAYLVGGFWALLSMAWHVWPTRRVAARLERSLDREGGRSRLSVVGGGGAATPGVQQY
jgi:hypothetical protein